jgi:hypothetical protein
MEDRTEFKCEHCKKLYSSYKSRWLHIKKYHNTDVSQKLANVSNDVSQKLVNNSQDNLYKCKYCDNEYKHRSSKSKHEKYCKESNNLNTNDISELKKQNDAMKKQNDDMKKQLDELKLLIQKSMKIHPPDLLEKSKIFLNKSDRPN